MHPLSPEVLPPKAMEQLLQAAAGDPVAQMLVQAIEALGEVYTKQAPHPATLEVLLAWLRKESDCKVCGLIALTLQEIHTRQGLDPAVIEPLTT